MSSSVPEGEIFCSTVEDKGNPLLAIDGLLQTYQGMSFADITKLTMPQMILLGHAASVNKERGEEYYEWKEQFKKSDKKQDENVINFDELDSTQQMAAMMSITR